jgi:hypothetical protein
MAIPLSALTRKGWQRGRDGREDAPLRTVAGWLLLGALLEIGVVLLEGGKLRCRLIDAPLLHERGDRLQPVPGGLTCVPRHRPAKGRLVPAHCAAPAPQLVMQEGFHRETGQQAHHQREEERPPDAQGGTKVCGKNVAPTTLNCTMRRAQNGFVDFRRQRSSGCTMDDAWPSPPYPRTLTRSDLLTTPPLPTLAAVAGGRGAPGCGRSPRSPG